MVRRRRTATVAARTVQAARSHRQRNDKTVAAIAVITAARRSRRSNGRDNTMIATVTAATSITVITAATAVRAAVAAGSLTPDCRADCLALSAASGPPPAAAAAGPPDCRQCLLRVGRRRPARVEAALSAVTAGARRSRKPVQPCSRRPFTMMPFTSDGDLQPLARE